ncbi:unnamed protein product [Effrenium voratum]|nr:unnamed protein product [Effrenium voratum]CAJ1429439.1 unnamed protein product [Effrenium voratum]
MCMQRMHEIHHSELDFPQLAPHAESMDDALPSPSDDGGEEAAPEAEASETDPTDPSPAQRQRIPVADAHMSPLEVNFSQMRANPLFRDGRSLDEAVQQIKPVRWKSVGSSASGAKDETPVWLLKAPFPPIEVMKWRCKLRDESGRPLVDPETGGELIDSEDKWFTLDNRRLYCLQKVAVSLWPERAVAEVARLPPTAVHKVRQLKKFRTLDRGCSIMVGSRTGGPVIGRWSWKEALGIQEPKQSASESQVQMRRRPRRNYEQEQAAMLAKQRQPRGRPSEEDEEDSLVKVTPWRGLIGFVIVYIVARCLVLVMNSRTQ